MYIVSQFTCETSFRSPSERFLRVSSYDDHITCGYYLMYFCYFVISNFIVNKNLILNKLIIFISAGRSSHSGEIQQNQELILTAIKFCEFCQTGLKEKGPLFNHRKFLTKRIITVYSDIPFSKSLCQTETCHLIMQCKSMTGFYIRRNFTGRCFRIEHSKDRLQKQN